MKKLISIFILAVFPFFAIAAEDTKNSVTIYSSQKGNFPRPLGSGFSDYSQVNGYAIVKQKRDINLDAKRSKIKFTDVAAYIDPTTVTFKSLTDEKTKVLEQNFNYDLVSRQKILERFIDQNIQVEQATATGIEVYKGKLLSARDGIVLQTDDGKINTITNYSNVKLPELPGGLITKPTLVWDVLTDKTGKHNVETTYETKGMSWWADYNMLFQEGKDENSGFLDISSWVTIVNQSGATFNNSQIKLVAGEVNRAQPNYGYAAPMMKASRDMMAMESAPAGFAEKAFFEYHLYTLGRPTDLSENSTKQIELFPMVSKVPVKKEFLFNGSEVGVYVNFKNSKENKIGMPLPAGRIRVNKMDKDDGSVEFIGEDNIEHTPENKEVKIKIGNAFDVFGERKILNSLSDQNRRVNEETVEIKLTNSKKADVIVKVVENVGGDNCKISGNNFKFEKEDAFTINFPIKISSGKEEKLNFKRTCSW